MNGRHVMAQGRVQHFVRLWNAAGWPDRVHSLNGADLTLTDLETLLEPRQVVRTIEQLQALPLGTKLAVQGDRAAQVDTLDWDVTPQGEVITVKRIVYVGTDLYDLLADPGPVTRDTLRRMLPAVVIDPVD